MNEESNENNDTYAYKYIQFTLSPKEKEKIEEFAEQKGYRTTSDFVRRTLFDHIRREENPELFIDNENGSINPLLLERISENITKVLENQEFILQREDVIDEIKNMVFEMHKLAEMESMSQEREMIIELLEQHQSLSLRQIQEQTGLAEDVVFKILSDLNIFKITTTGRFALR